MSRITRERLLDGSHLAELHANAPQGYVIRSDEEIAASLKGVLAKHTPGRPVWVFGYGSLIWNPAFDFVERRVAHVHGWHRRFCLWLYGGRGTFDHPGLMLALDRGGQCRGIAFRLPDMEFQQELLLLWRREMLTGAYEARWVNARTDDGVVPAITFVANRHHDRFAGLLPEEQVADRLATASGPLGTCAEYLVQTADHLRDLGIRDENLERLRRRVSSHRGGRGHARPTQAVAV